MVRIEFRFMLAAAAMLFAAPAAAADAAGYSIAGASQARVNYSYLTMDAVTKKLRPRLAAQLPADGRLVILNVNFRSLGNADKMVQLNPADLQLQWDSGGAGAGAAPVLGAHISKDFWAMDGGFYTSMRPDKYELFAIVPKAARQIDLAQRQADGSFKVVKARIGLSAAKP